MGSFSSFLDMPLGHGSRGALLCLFYVIQLYFLTLLIMVQKKKKTTGNFFFTVKWDLYGSLEAHLELYVLAECRLHISVKLIPDKGRVPHQPCLTFYTTNNKCSSCPLKLRGSI